MGIDGAFWDGLFIDLVKGEGRDEEINESDVKKLKVKAEEQIKKLSPDIEYMRFWTCEFDKEDGRGGIKMVETEYRRGVTIVVAELLIIIKTAYDMGFRLPTWCARTAYIEDFEVGCLKIGRSDDDEKDIQLSFFETNSENIMKSGKVGALIIFTFDDIKKGLESGKFVEYCIKKQGVDVLANIDHQ